MKKVDNIGRITIPKDLRTKYNLETGMNYEIIEESDSLTIKPLNKNFTISNEDMKALRKMYIMLSDSGILDAYYDEILARITKKSESKCSECGAYLFLTNENTYKCFKCE